MKTDAFLFDMRGGMQFNPANDRGFVSDKPFFGKNPTYGAAISYYLSKPQTNVALRIRDGAGTQVREITGNDLRDGARSGHQPRLLGSASSAAGAGPGRPAAVVVVAVAAASAAAATTVPTCMPGEYRVTLVVDGKDVATKPVRVTGDKDMPMTDAERKTWHDTALNLHDMQGVANAAAEAVTTLGTQVTAAEALVKSAAERPAGGGKTALTDVNTKLADLRRAWLGLNGPGQGGGGGGGGFGGQQANVRGQLGQTKGQIMGSTSMPTAQQIRVAGELREDTAKLVADTNALIAAVPAMYDALGATGAKPTALKPVGPVPAGAMLTATKDGGQTTKDTKQTLIDACLKCVRVVPFVASWSVLLPGRTEHETDRRSGFCDGPGCAERAVSDGAGDLEFLHHQRRFRQGR